MTDCDEKRESVSGSSEFTSNNEECVSNYIEIFINSIENLFIDGALILKVIVEHNDIVIGQSRSIRIDSNYEKISSEYHVEFSAILPYDAGRMESICSIVSTPVIITVLETLDDRNHSVTNYGRKSLDENQQKRDSSISENRQKILGVCNIDLLPIVLGEEEFEEKIVLEVPSYAWDSNAVSWGNLPRLSVSAVRSDSSYSPSQCGCFNVLSITVESIYNLPESFNDETDYKCATVLFSENFESEQSFLIFEAGKWTNYKDVEKMKTWKSLQHLNSRARFSKYKLDSDYDSVKNNFKEQFDLKKAVDQNTERIEWNCMHRMAIGTKEVERVKQHIKKYKKWPFEIMLTEKSTDLKGMIEENTTIYQCYADISQLIYPGRTKTRILTQLYTKSSSKMEEETGIPINIFDFLQKNQKANDQEKSVADGSVSSQTLNPEYVESYPVYSESGAPVLVLVQFELWRPFLEARVLEDYTEALQRLRQLPKPKAPLYVYTPDLVHDQYMSCIQQLTDVICEDYKNFLERCECEDNFEKKMIAKSKGGKDNLCKCESACSLEDEDEVTCPYYYIPDELSRFKQFLQETGKFAAITNTLKKNIIHLLDQKFSLNYSNWYSQEMQDLVASCYSYLVDEMHHALNKKLDVRLSADYIKFKTCDDYWYRSEEAYEYEDLSKSESLLTKLIASKRNDPNSWILYAIHFMKRSEINEAIECCRETIRLNSRHKIGLLFYGILLAMKEDYSDAEIFLQAAVHFYPRFIEAWTVLHIFYVKIQYYPGIELTLQVAKQCVQDRVREEDSLYKIFKEEPMAWSTLPNEFNVFNMTAVLLLKLNLYKFAGLALMQESVKDKCDLVKYLYFLSVSQYLQSGYEDAIKNLTKAQEIIGMDFSINSLLAHSLYKTGNFSKAAELYEAVDSLYDRPENIHLIHMRLGFHYIEVEEYERARCVFLRACKYPPTCKTWLGVGTSCYHLNKFEDSELALMEANRIDDEDPEVWGYLCLLSMALFRYHEFMQCYRQTVKNKLKSKKIWQLIKNSMESLGYPSSISVLKNDCEQCTCQDKN